MVTAERHMAEVILKGDVESHPALASVVERNIAAPIERRRSEEAKIGWHDRLADIIARFTAA